MPRLTHEHPYDIFSHQISEQVPARGWVDISEEQVPLFAGNPVFLVDGERVPLPEAEPVPEPEPAPMAKAAHAKEN